jgi:hypothetical protein
MKVVLRHAVSLLERDRVVEAWMVGQPSTEWVVVQQRKKREGKKKGMDEKEPELELEGGEIVWGGWLVQMGERRSQGRVESWKMRSEVQLKKALVLVLLHPP